MKSPFAKTDKCHNKKTELTAVRYSPNIAYSEPITVRTTVLTLDGGWPMTKSTAMCDQGRERTDRGWSNPIGALPGRQNGHREGASSLSLKDPQKMLNLKRAVILLRIQPFSWADVL